MIGSPGAFKIIGPSLLPNRVSCRIFICRTNKISRLYVDGYARFVFCIYSEFDSRHKQGEVGEDAAVEEAEFSMDVLQESIDMANVTGVWRGVEVV
jgi:hypothetical protein